MKMIYKPKQEKWGIEFGYDDAYQLDKLLKGELKYKKSISKLSERNYNQYINIALKREEVIGLNKKTILIINGEIRNSGNFIKWANKIKNFSYFYFYTDKSSYSKLDKSDRDFLENISDGFCFSEEDPNYQESLRKVNHQSNMLQWLKLKHSLKKWRDEWKEMKVRTILRMRTDIAFLNPYLLEYQIKKGFLNIIKKGQMIARSDLIFAFDIEDALLLEEFYDSIFSFYLNEEWINYPYIPLNPDLIIRANGSIRIEWNNFPKKYIGINPTKNQFFEKIAFSYNEMLNDFNMHSYLENDDSKRRLSLFGNLSSVRNQSDKLFSSEKIFAHYLLSKGMISLPHNDIFSGKIIREKNKEIKYAINVLFILIKKIIKNLTIYRIFNFLKRF